MKHSFNIIKLMVAIILLMGLFSCAANTNGLVKHGCRGIKAHPHYKKHR
jgi:hypothetical protein